MADVLSPYNVQALMRDTISLTMLNAGIKVNVVPTIAEAGLDCRLLPGTDADAFMKRLRDLLGPGDFKIEYIQRPDDAPPSPTSGEAWDAIKSVVASDFKDARVVPWMTTGGTDSRVRVPRRAGVRIRPDDSRRGRSFARSRRRRTLSSKSESWHQGHLRFDYRPLRRAK